MRSNKVPLQRSSVSQPNCPHVHKPMGRLVKHSKIYIKLESFLLVLLLFPLLALEHELGLDACPSVLGSWWPVPCAPFQVGNPATESSKKNAKNIFNQGWKSRLSKKASGFVPLQALIGKPGFLWISLLHN